jgi:hypothetical protein
VAGPCVYFSIKATIKTSATCVSDPIESAKTAYRAVRTSLDLHNYPTNIDSHLEKLNTAARQYNNERLSYNAYEITRGNSPWMSSFMDTAAIGCLLMSGEAALLSAFPTSGEQMYNIVLTLFSWLGVALALPVKIVFTALSSLLINDSPITWLITLFLIPGFILFPASLVMPPAERLLKKFSPEVKKYYNLLLLMLFIFVVLVQAAHEFFSAIQICTENSSSWLQWVNPLCAIRMEGRYATPAELIKETVANVTTDLSNVAAEPFNATVTTIRQAYVYTTSQLTYEPHHHLRLEYTNTSAESSASFFSQNTSATCDAMAPTHNATAMHNTTN